MKFPFPPAANFFARWSLLGGLAVLIGGGAFATVYRHSPAATAQGREIIQPLPFSHQHHVQGLGLDCRFCHTTVEKSAQAGYPDAATCLGCHSQIWKQADVLKPVRESEKNGKPLYWWRVHRLPDHVYFDHSIHIAKGVGCVSCHGNVSHMAVVTQQRSFLMRDCLSCHDNPAKNLRPRHELFNENWQSNPQIAEQLMKDYNVRHLERTDCNLCHR